MAKGQLNKAITHLRSVVDKQDRAGLPDSALLERYVRQHDEAAFEVLVRRHGPMVMGVCRRVLHNRHDAEDAFQATFLVLVRKASTLRSPGTVGNWLYGVAYRTALEARKIAAKRGAKEAKVVVQRQAAEDTWADLRPVLDQELERLPDKYRAVLVLCDLEAKTRKEGARHLGWPEGTVASRLAAARTMLAKRLIRHGLSVSGGALAVILFQNASASVPSLLVSSTLQTAALFSSGQVTQIISIKVAALIQGVLKTMLLAKLKIHLAVLLVVGCVVAGATLPAYRALAGPEIRAPDIKPMGQNTPGATEARGAGKPQAPKAAPETLRSNTDRFGLRLQFIGPKDAPYLTIELMTYEVQWQRLPPHWAGDALIKPALAGKLLDHLTQGGYFDRAREGPLANADRVEGPTYALSVWAAGNPAYTENLGWDLSMVQRLDKLRELIDGEAAKLMDPLLVQLEPQRKQWEKTQKERTQFAKQEWRMQPLGRHAQDVLAVAFSPDGKRLATGSVDQTAMIWDLATGKEQWTLRGHQQDIHSLAFSPDSKLLATGSGDKSVKIWDLSTGKELRTLHGHSEKVLCVRFSPDGKTLASTGFDNVIRLWDTATWQERTALENDAKGVYALAFAPDGKTLAVAGNDGKVRLWDVPSGKRIAILKVDAGPVPITAIGFSPDGKVLAAGTKNSLLWLWDMPEREVRKVVQGGSKDFNSLVFTPGGAGIVCPVLDNAVSIRIWDVQSGREVKALAGQRTWVKAVAISPDGKTLASGGSDGTVVLWKLAE